MSAQDFSKLVRGPLGVVLSGLLTGCAGNAAQTPSVAPSSAPAAPVPATVSSALTAPPVPEPAPAATAQSPEGLRVELLGVKFVPKVETVRTELGFVVKVTLSATASESRTLLAPKNGALAFAGDVKRAGKSEVEHFGDEREGDGEEPLPAGTSVKLSREWPGKLKVRPLGNGDSLELDVALWGLGTTAADRRPVKQFLHVKAKVEKWKGRASVEVPPSMKGKK
jgi:hypothetical protein